MKAPHFEDLPGFNKGENGLFEVRSRVCGGGFVFVNLDATGTGTGTGSGREDRDGEGGVLEELDGFLRRNNILSSVWVKGKTVEGEFNWKFACKFLSSSLSVYLSCSPYSSNMVYW